MLPSAKNLLIQQLIYLLLRILNIHFTNTTLTPHLSTPWKAFRSWGIWLCRSAVALESYRVPISIGDGVWEISQFTYLEFLDSIYLKLGQTVFDWWCLSFLSPSTAISSLDQDMDHKRAYLWSEINADKSLKYTDFPKWSHFSLSRHLFKYSSIVLFLFFKEKCHQRYESSDYYERHYLYSTLSHLFRHLYSFLQSFFIDSLQIQALLRTKLLMFWIISKQDNHENNQKHKKQFKNHLKSNHIKFFITFSLLIFRSKLS